MEILKTEGIVGRDLMGKRKTLSFRGEMRNTSFREYSLVDTVEDNVGQTRYVTGT